MMWTYEEYELPSDDGLAGQAYQLLDDGYCVGSVDTEEDAQLICRSVNLAIQKKIRDEVHAEIDRCRKSLRQMIDADIKVRDAQKPAPSRWQRFLETLRAYAVNEEPRF